jgi:hypothetical protein
MFEFPDLHKIDRSLEVFWTDRKNGRRALTADRSLNDLALNLNTAARVRFVAGGIQLGHCLEVRHAFVETLIAEPGQRDQDQDGGDKKLKLFGFHGFKPYSGVGNYNTPDADLKTG